MAKNLVELVDSVVNCAFNLTYRRKYKDMWMVHKFCSFYIHNILDISANNLPLHREIMNIISLGRCWKKCWKIIDIMSLIEENYEQGRYKGYYEKSLEIRGGYFCKNKIKRWTEVRIYKRKQESKVKRKKVFLFFLGRLLGQKRVYLLSCLLL